MPVGQSLERTACKHAILKKAAGQFTGAASCLQSDKIVFIDTCAGDGKPSEFSGTSSPEIFAKQIAWLITKRNCQAQAYLIESDQTTFWQLQVSIQEIAQRIGFAFLPNHVHLIHGDYRSPTTAAQLALTTKSIVFLYIDPNSANQVELSTELRTYLPRLTTYLVTLGCNASGVKQMPEAKRRKWFERLKYLLGVLSPRHDACWIRLTGDRDQWTYLWSIPATWRSRAESTLRALQKLWPKGMKHDWYSEANYWKSPKSFF